MKIVLITSRYYPYITGGAQISNKILVEGIKRRNIDIGVISLGEKNNIENINNIKITRLYLSKLTTKYLKKIPFKKKSEKIKFALINNFHIYDYLIYKKIFNILKKYPKDTIIHTSDMHSFYQIFWWKAAKKNNLKVIHTLRDPFFIKEITLGGKKNILINYINCLRKFIFRYYSKKYIDYVHSPSEYMIKVHKKNNFNFKKVKVIYNTIDINIINSKFEEKTIDILYVGRIIKEKGIELLIKTLQDTKLVQNTLFIGDGDLKNKVIKNNIKITGWLNSNCVYEYMKKAKIIILPSKWEEAFGRVLIEGIANGTLVIGSNKGAIPEVLGNRDLYLFNVENGNELERKIKRILLLSKDEYEKEVKELQKFIKKYEYDNHIREFEKFYEDVIKS